MLEQLGVPLDLAPEQVARCVTEAGIGFCFAARFTPACGTPARSGARSAYPPPFNFLGPLTNPARPRAGAVGCFDKRMAPDGRRLRGPG
ncbi:hypothetical protein [Micromonospora sp. b486]|uniref:hypothetical protein n=1 Tax=Micromonospora sp. b486 TaxID=3053986 RepID=UPI00338D505B